MPNRRDDETRGVPTIPGSYFDRIMEARALTDRNELDPAAGIYQRIIDRISRLPEHRRKPGSDQAVFLILAAASLISIRAKQGDYDAATDLCRQLQTWDAKDEAGWRRRILTLRVEKGEVEEGLADLQALAEAESANFAHWFTLAEQALEADRYEVAETALAHAEAVMWEDEDEDAPAAVYFIRFELHRKQGRWQEAARAWEEAAELEDSIEESRELVVRMLLGAGLLDDAERFVDAELLGEATAGYYNGLIAYRRGDKIRARRFWREAAEADVEEYPESIVDQAAVLCWLGEPAQALGRLLTETGLAHGLGYRDALVLALAWALQGNLVAARTNLELALQRIPASEGKDQLPAVDWFDFDELVTNEEVKSELRPFFAASQA